MNLWFVRMLTEDNQQCLFISLYIMSNVKINTAIIMIKMMHTKPHTLLWYLCVEEWARVEELWDLEEWWLPANDASASLLITLSVAGTFFEIYYKRYTLSDTCVLEIIEAMTECVCRTYIHHWDLLRARAGVVGPVGQAAIGVIQTHVLPQVTVHLLPLFPRGEAIVRQRHSFGHWPRVTFTTSHTPKC